MMKQIRFKRLIWRHYKVKMMKTQMLSKQMILPIISKLAKDKGCLFFGCHKFGPILMGYPTVWRQNNYMIVTSESSAINVRQKVQFF